MLLIKNYPPFYRLFFNNVSLWQKVFLGRIASLHLFAYLWLARDKVESHIAKIATADTNRFAHTTLTLTIQSGDS